MINALDATLREVDEQLGKGLEPIQASVRLLTTIPGVSDVIGNVIVAEVGTDMSLPDAGTLDLVG